MTKQKETGPESRKMQMKKLCQLMQTRENIIAIFSFFAYTYASDFNPLCTAKLNKPNLLQWPESISMQIYVRTARQVSSFAPYLYGVKSSQQRRTARRTKVDVKKWKLYAAHRDNVNGTLSSHLKNENEMKRYGQCLDATLPAPHFVRDTKVFVSAFHKFSCQKE